MIYVILKNNELLEHCFTTKKGAIDHIGQPYNNSSKVKDAFIIGKDLYSIRPINVVKKRSGRGKY